MAIKMTLKNKSERKLSVIEGQWCCGNKCKCDIKGQLCLVMRPGSLQTNVLPWFAAMALGGCCFLPIQQ